MAVSEAVFVVDIKVDYIFFRDLLDSLEGNTPMHTFLH